MVRCKRGLTISNLDIYLNFILFAFFLFPFYFISYSLNQLFRARLEAETSLLNGF